MDNDQMPNRNVEDDELARRLEAYAEARLSPSLSATTRMRTTVMVAAHRQAALLRADADRAQLEDTAAQLTSHQRTVWRRPTFALLAACLAVALAVSSVAATQPGGPLYGARVWAETLTLPTSAAERAAAEVHRLQERLIEAATAMAAGNDDAANAALAAYNGIVAEATSGTNGNAAANATLNAAVRRNIEVLTILASRVPDQARDAIERAIQRSSAAAEEMRGRPGVSGLPLTTPGNTPKPGSGNRPDRTPNPNKPTPAPADSTLRPNQDGTPKSHPTPKPRVTPDPDAATSAPEHTPKAGGKPSTPPGNGNQGN